MSIPRPAILRSIIRPAPPLTRSLHGKATPAIPPPMPERRILTAEEFLKAIGRDAHEKVKVETWEGLFSLQRDELKQAGVPVKDRKYILWALEKYRQGEDPKDFAHPAKPKKTIRGWGPKVQNGKKIR